MIATFEMKLKPNKRSGLSCRVRRLPDQPGAAASSTPDVSKLPTVFLGVAWDAGWEFDMPCVVYAPIKLYTAFGNNSGTIDGLVEDYCMSITDNCAKPAHEWHKADLKEFKWRGWSLRGFARRKQAWHVRIEVKWWVSNDGEVCFKMGRRKETWGPLPASAFRGRNGKKVRVWKP